MPIVQDQLTPLRTSVTYEDLNNLDYATRYLHNGSDTIKCEFFGRPTGPRIIYYRTNGSKAASYSMEEDYICDLTYDSTNNKYYTTRVLEAEPNLYALALEEVDDEGQVLNTIVDYMDVIGGSTASGIEYQYNALTSGITALTINPDNEMVYIKVSGSVYNIDLTESYSASPSGNYHNEGTSGIDLTSSVISESGTFSFQFNETDDNFIQYIEYDDNTTEVRARTLDFTTSGTVVQSTSELFLDIPDWAEWADVNDPYLLFLHGNDNKTLLYFRRYGSTELNPVKVEATDGVLDDNLFSSSSVNFLTSSVQKGDTIKLFSASPALSPTIKHKTVVQVIDSNNLVLSPGEGSSFTSVNFEVATNADLMQFNTDRTLSAFASVNVDDYSLRAGTGDTSNVICEVINAWGDPLEGKTVSFVVSQGDGAVNPPSDTTTISGVAETVYTAGITPGAVEVTVTISD